MLRRQQGATATTIEAITANTSKKLQQQHESTATALEETTQHEQQDEATAKALED